MLLTAAARLLIAAAAAEGPPSQTTRGLLLQAIDELQQLLELPGPAMPTQALLANLGAGLSPEAGVGEDTSRSSMVGGTDFASQSSLAGAEEVEDECHLKQDIRSSEDDQGFPATSSAASVQTSGSGSKPQPWVRLRSQPVDSSSADRKEARSRSKSLIATMRHSEDVEHLRGKAGWYSTKQLAEHLGFTESQLLLRAAGSP